MHSDIDRKTIEQARDLCRARQIACVALANSDITHAKSDVEYAFAQYRSAADLLNKILEIM
jgi:hypothetical protein